MGFDNLNKISATIFRPATNIAIQHVVKVAHKDKTGRREYAHAEYDYTSNYYVDKKYVKSIKLTFDSHIVIEDLSRDWTDERAVKIGYIQMPIFTTALQKVTDWFIDDKYDELYYIEDEILKLNLDFVDLREVISFGYGRAISFTPTVICMEDVYYEGVEMIINNNKCVGYITFDNLIAMNYIFKNINLYALGLEMMNYIRRPEFGEFSTEIGDVFTDSSFKQPDMVDESEVTSHLNKPEINTKLSGFFK